MSPVEKLYTHRLSIHNTRAAEVMVPLILNVKAAASVLDVGCGTGTWLKVFGEQGVGDLLGIDGHYVDYGQLVIDAEKFRPVDLRQPFDLKRTFDVVLCLEVAEHLPEASADGLVASLCRHAETIIFSAAIPGQGGQHHINEQWPAYWQEKFARHQFKQYDVLRPLVWNNPAVDVWYRQNVLVYSIKEIPAAGSPVFAEVHPEIWTAKIKAYQDAQALADLYTRGEIPVSAGLRTFASSIYRFVVNLVK